MKHFLSVIAALLVFQSVNAQITITADDMPVNGDMLGYSNAAPTGTNFNPADSGMNQFWNYNLVSNSKGVDTYKLAAQVSPSYGNTISSSAIGYKVADSIPGLSTITMLPVSITDIYTFFQRITTPRAAYVASAYTYKLSNIIPEAANYTDPDVWYFFPLNYGSGTDSTHYSLTLNLLGQAQVQQNGYRITRVDGWGTITTPYFTTPANCIRVRSEIHEIDSVTYSGTTYGVPRVSVEYKFLVNGEHYPALWVTSNVSGGTEAVTTVTYRDTVNTPSEVISQRPVIAEISVFPNPAADGVVTLNLPADWKNFQAEVFDVQAKTVATFNNERTINVASLPTGQYIVRITSGSNTGYARIIR